MEEEEEQPYDLKKLIIIVETLLDELNTLRKRKNYRKYYRKYRQKLKRNIAQKKKDLLLATESVTRKDGEIILYFD